MRIIPVLDLQDGQVVRGIAGQRDQYRPIVSRLTDSSRPMDVTRAFRDRLGLSEFYLADLGAIGGGEPALETYASLRSLGCALWVDAGVRNLRQAMILGEEGIETIVLGLETIQGPWVLEECRARLGSDRLVFSLDLKGGQPLGDVMPWGTTEPFGLAERAIAAGLRRLIVLDLAHVGTGSGIGTEGICRRLTQAYPHLDLVAGGGIRSLTDLQELAGWGVRTALVASALHDGRIGEEDLNRLAYL